MKRKSFLLTMFVCLTAHARTIAAQTLSTEPVQLPTGALITPAVAPHSVYQRFNPGLGDLPNFIAGQPVTTALSPDGSKLLVATSGYNLNTDAGGKTIPSQSNEYVFVYDTTVFPPKQTQVIQVSNTFVGLAWNPNGQEFYLSGGVDDKFYIYVRSGSTYSQAAAIALNHKTGNSLLSNAPAPLNTLAVPPAAAGIGVNQGGNLAIVTNLFNDSVSVIDLKARSKLSELDLRPGAIDPNKSGVPGGEYPFWAVIKADNKAYVSSVRDREIDVLALGNLPVVTARIPIQGQPNRMILNRAQNRLYVAVDNSDTVVTIDTDADKIVETFSSAGPRLLLPAGTVPKGANPNSLALSPDEKTLYITEGGINAVAVVNLTAAPGNRVAGLIPTGWYPTSVSVSADGRYLYVTNAKSLPGPNTGNCRGDTQAPGIPDCSSQPNQYILQIEKGGLLSMPVPSAVQLAELTGRVALNNHFAMLLRERDGPVMAAVRERVQHVIYIIKENRTYDQVLGDLEVGNGDPSITEFPEPLTPNFHSIARRFVTLDNFYDSGEVSGVGWNWTTSARTTDYAEKTQFPNYAGRGLNYDWEGTNRNVNVAIAALADRVKADPLLAPNAPPDPNLLPGTADVAAADGPNGEQGAGFIWDEALRAGLTVRNYGCFLDLARYQGPASLNPAFIPISTNPATAGLQQAFPTKPSLLSNTDPYFRGFDQANADYYNFQEWAREFDQFAASGNLPSLMLVRFPHDHFGSFGSALYGLNTPGRQIADNDYAVGLLVEKVANSRFKNNTLIFVIEDDAQDGPDHVDAHRSTAFVVGPYVKQGTVVSNHYTTVNMVRTIEAVLGLESTSLNAAAASPMTAVFDPYQVSWTYQSIVPDILRSTQLQVPARTSENSLPLTRRVAASAKDRHPVGWWQKRLGGMNYEEEDKVDTSRFNLELWKGMMGNAPYPAVRSGADLRENRKVLLQKFGID